MKLHELQHQFKNYLLNDDETIEQAIVSNKDINAHERLMVYKDSYIQRLIDLLAIDFPRLKELMGEEFDTQIELYLKAHPSQHYLPNYLGKYLADFLAQNAQSSLWQDMARLEYAIIEISDKKNEHALTLEKLSTLPPEQWTSVCFILCDAVTMMSFSSNAPFIWLKQNAKPAEKETTWLIWRKEFQVHLRPLAKEEVLIIEWMQQQKDFVTICDLLCEIMSEQQAGQYLMQFLGQCLNDKLLKDNLG